MPGYVSDPRPKLERPIRVQVLVRYTDPEAKQKPLRATVLFLVPRTELFKERPNNSLELQLVADEIARSYRTDTSEPLKFGVPKYGWNPEKTLMFKKAYRRAKYLRKKQREMEARNATQGEAAGTGSQAG